MSINLEEIYEENYKNNKRNKYLAILKEIFIFVIFNATVFILGMIIINLQAFKLYFFKFFGKYLGFNNNIEANIVVKYTDINNIKIKKITSKNIDKVKEYIKQRNYYLKLIEKKLGSIKKADKVRLYYKDLNKYLFQKKQNIKFVFNLLPPGKRIVIPTIGVNAPIIDLKFITNDKLEKGDFDSELYHGVVKYPYTPDPGNTGNILIFGHTSYYWWKKNPYGDVFAKIPLLKHGDIIEIIWNGKVYKYKVFKKLIRRPYQVKATYEYYNTGKNLTIMGCYPIGTDRERLLVIAKQIENIGDEVLAYKHK